MLEEEEMKGYSWLGLSILFFVFAMLNMYYTRGNFDATTGISQPMPLYNLGMVAFTVILYGLSFMCFSTYFFGYRITTHIIGVIPARMSSTRFPGKPLAKINNIPMIEHVWRNAKLCKSLEEVYVATCDVEIENFIRSIGGKVVMTSPTHQRASDRVAEAVQHIESFGHKYDVIVMIQGDEPLITPDMIDVALQPLLRGDATVSNLAEIITGKDIKDSNTIKIVTDINNFALYFSRQPIPYDTIAQKQVCVIPFTREMLDTYTNLKPTYLEKIESVDMMRLVENGYKVKIILTDHKTHSVDVPKDIKVVEKMMKCKQS
jgi:3-deoxy-manno-octulosonate cytidylyltransferase (CMP-KDO synthetase)